MSVRPSVCLSAGITSAATELIFLKFDIGALRETADLVKMGQKCRVFYMKT
jgi:hypothetical protein